MSIPLRYATGDDNCFAVRLLSMFICAGNGNSDLWVYEKCRRGSGGILTF